MNAQLPTGMKTHTYYSQLHIKDAVVLRLSQKSDPFFFSAAASCLSHIANNSFEVTDEKKIVRRKRKPGSDKRKIQKHRQQKIQKIAADKIGKPEKN